MKLKKLLLIALIAAITASCAVLSSCQLSEHRNDKETSAETDTGETSASNIPDGIDINYTMDYLAEDLTKYLTLGEYKGLTAEVEMTYEVNDDYFASELLGLLENEATYEQITDRETKEGDVICVDYVGTLDGVAFQGGTASNVSITLSDNSGYIPGFTDGMYGVVPGNTVSYPVTFPESYPNSPDLEGKETIFTVTVHYIEGEEIVPTLTDDFVKAYLSSDAVGEAEQIATYIKENSESGKCETADDFIKYYKGFLEHRRANELKENGQSTLWNMIVKNATVKELPQKAVDSLYWLNRSNYEAYAKQYGVSYEQFLSQYVGMDDETLLAYTKDYITEDIVIYSIVKAEGIEVTDAEYEDGVKMYMEENGMTREELIEQYGEDRIKSVLQWNKLMDCLTSWNTISEKLVTE